MEVNEWKEFLLEWEEETNSLLRDAEKMGYVFEKSDGMMFEVFKSGSRSFPGATKSDIEKSECRIHKQLPNSYKNFLKASNGWRQLAVDIDDTLLYPASNLDWLRNTDKARYDILCRLSRESSDIPDSAYYLYGELLDWDTSLRDTDVENLLALSDHCDSADYFLNANVKNSDGEWEAILFLWEEGMIRYHSFADLMAREKIRTFQKLKYYLELE